MQEVAKFETDQLKQQLEDRKQEAEAMKTELCVRQSRLLKDFYYKVTHVARLFNSCYCIIDNRFYSNKRFPGGFIWKMYPESFLKLSAIFLQPQATRNI